jgi:phospholipid/cholesterol/gamma-HCH transport system permease protein
MLGASILDMGRAGRYLWSIFIRTLYYTFRGRREKGDVWRYGLEMGNRSVFFMTVTMGFVGMLFVHQAAFQLNQITGDLHLVGAAYIEFTIRELAASVGAVVLATRVGAGIAAEIGSMVVTDQVDAMRMNGTDPVEYLVSPRFIASLVTGTAIIIYTAFIMVISGMIAAQLYFDVNPRIFLNFMYVDWHEVLTGFVKCWAYCAAIPVVSAYCGLSTFGGSEGVGWATTRAVVNSAIAIILLDAIISTSAYFIFY